jgi:hypothetical protein
MVQSYNRSPLLPDPAEMRSQAVPHGILRAIGLDFDHEQPQFATTMLPAMVRDPPYDFRREAAARLYRHPCV